MEKKALKFLIALFVVPIIIAIVFALTTDNKTPIGPSHSDNHESSRVITQQTNNTSTFIYISVFTLVVIGVGIWAFVKKKGNV